MSRIADLEVGATITCSKHNGPATLSARMKRESCRICDECLTAYKIAYSEARRNSARARKIEAGEWLNRDSLEGESWRTIPGFSGYEASTLGRIRSIDRADTLGRIAFGRVLSLHVNSRGYVQARVRGDSRKAGHTVTVHLLVALAFIGPRPAHHDVAHNDGDPGNNAPLNLRYATRKDNEADKVLHGTRFIAAGELNGHARLTEVDVLSIRERLSHGAPLGMMAKEYGLTSSGIYSIKTRRTWKHC